GETVLKTQDDRPLELTLGEGVIPTSIENALVDMNVGDSKTITLEPAEAFGQRVDDLVVELPREGFTAGTDMKVGSMVSMSSSEGKKFTGAIIELNDDKVTVDFNHPLAGKKLIFTVTVVSST
ncbi:MAG: FKBP-type peptidyl-prolyl cis-trans isomerase, partial [Candidatus Thermoplasmatota archaeon]|nr:FKBP-type peptidyl-prolyl cis-trans isomerase [Candidatus Thermoplasmatota archaeon]